ncbi:AfsR/SARP family transcriptional regulator [Saccharothrix coeruleofusca]|uniref:OmpR/PhoB-type domain-containing protein n=1 Tax=Saccharothrix coeruleofusca TaxID=33919 RepID=A0A918EFR2_9PSEU|nr:BTAD domain-containing putative transcriptional regulator [Saccharothrix coeruleofusca]MBP2337892.1 DNA-binding SARP family transcriptional activator [Saccharothrix coeruleofusca]GGP62987.1 hypothetical protein GCM10010185_39380 [Saccharothrix coeruleofusca]
MEFRILGPVEVARGDEPATPLRPKPGQVLAVLAARCGRRVAVDCLLNLLWGDHPPYRARKTLQVHVSALRAAGVPVVHRDSGYAVLAMPQQVDVHRFRELTARAAATADLGRRWELYLRALALWRGSPLAGTGAEPLRAWLCAPLEAEHLAAVEAAAALRARLGG